MISDGLVRRVLGSDDRARRFGGELRYAVTFAAVLVMLFWLGYQIQLARFMYSSLAMNDFGKFYYSTRMFLDGEDMYGPSPATTIPVNDSESQDFWNMNPPHFHIVMLPLAVVPPLTAILIWWGLSLAALVASLRAIVRELGLRWTRRGVFWTVFWLVIFSPTSITILTGQLSLLLMWPVTLAWIAARQGRWTRAAVLLGITASIKPFLGIFLPWLALRDRRLGATMAGAALGCFGIGIGIFGPQAYLAWIRVLSSIDWAWVPMNASIHGLVDRVLSTSPRFSPIIDAPPVASALAASMALIVVGTAFVHYAGNRSDSSLDHDFAGLLLSALLVSPLGWMYYLLLAVGPMTAVGLGAVGRRFRGRDLLMALAVPGLIWPLAITGLWRTTPWASISFGSTYGWTLLALWIGVLLETRDRGVGPSFR